jgi:hypothetical protein
MFIDGANSWEESLALFVEKVENPAIRGTGTAGTLAHAQTRSLPFQHPLVAVLENAPMMCRAQTP